MLLLGFSGFEHQGRVRKNISNTSFVLAGEGAMTGHFVIPGGKKDSIEHPQMTGDAPHQPHQPPIVLFRIFSCSM